MQRKIFRKNIKEYKKKKWKGNIDKIFKINNKTYLTHIYIKQNERFRKIKQN